MRPDKLVSLTAATVIGLGSLGTAGLAQGGMFDLMNPGRWFGNDYDRYDRYDRYYGYGPYRYGRHGWGGPYGGWGSPYGWGGGPWGGGWGGYPGYGPGNTIVVTPQGGKSSDRPAEPPRLPE